MGKGLPLHFDTIFARLEQSVERIGHLGEFPAFQAVVNWARKVTGRPTQGDPFDADSLATRYCAEATRRVRDYKIQLNRWESHAYNARGARPEAPTPWSIATFLSPDVGRYQAMERLNEARDPHRLARLNLTDPLRRSHWD